MDIKQNNKIFLSGGGDEKQSLALDKVFFSSLPRKGSFLYIPIALRNHKLYQTAHLWVNSVLKLNKREDLSFEKADDLSLYNYEKVKNFDGIFIGGGNTWSLMKEIENSNFSKILLNYIKKGGKVYGGSAGAIILGKKINSQEDKKNVHLKNNDGFGLLGEYSVSCHFDNEKESFIKKWVKNNNLPLLCIPEESGVIIEDQKALCVGSKPCMLYFPNNIKKEVRARESFNIKLKQTTEQSFT